MLKESENEEEGITPAMIVRRREYIDPCSLRTPLQDSSTDSINPQSLSIKFSHRKWSRNNRMNPEDDSTPLKFNKTLTDHSSMIS